MSAGPLSEKTLDQIRRAGGNDLIYELFGVFLSHVESRRTTVLDAVKREDALAARKAFHSIRSSSVTIGLQALSERAAVLEDLAAKSQWDAVSQAIPRFEDDFARAVGYLKREVAKIADQLDGS